MVHRRVLTLLLALVVVATAGACASGNKATNAASTAPSSTSTPASGTGSSSTTAASTTCAASSTSTDKAGTAEVSPPGDIPDNQAFVAYSPADGSYTVKVPEGWARADGPQGVSFTDKFNTIRIETLAAAIAPTVARAQADEVPALSTSAPCVSGVKVANATRRAGSAVLITYQGDGAPDSVTGKVVREAVERYEFWNAGRQVNLTLSGAVGADNVDPWRVITDSFAWR